MSRLSRRHVLLGTAGLMCAVAPALRARAGIGTTEVAPGMHFRRGLDEDANARNEDAIANIGFIVGRDSVAVIDPGGSLADGQRLRARIREVTAVPIRYVVMSHVHPDHIFGAGAFTQDRPQFIGHARLPNAMTQRGEYYRAALERILGKGRAGPVVMPTRVVADREQIDLGGRVLLLKAHGVGHSDCDLSVFDPSSGTLMPADLLFVERVPSLDGGLKGWQTELAALRAIPAKRAIPGHGPVSVNWPEGRRISNGIWMCCCERHARLSSGEWTLATR